LDRFIKAAKFLQIRGLVKVEDDDDFVKEEPETSPFAGVSSGIGSEKKHRPPPKRKPYREDVVDNDSDDPVFLRQQSHIIYVSGPFLVPFIPYDFETYHTLINICLNSLCGFQRLLIGDP
jgi:hypothetical protein